MPDQEVYRLIEMDHIRQRMQVRRLLSLDFLFQWAQMSLLLQKEQRREQAGPPQWQQSEFRLKMEALAPLSKASSALPKSELARLTDQVLSTIERHDVRTKRLSDINKRKRGRRSLNKVFLSNCLLFLKHHLSWLTIRFIHQDHSTLRPEDQGVGPSQQPSASGNQGPKPGPSNQYYTNQGSSKDVQMSE
jgi:hypothetical protein